VKGLTHLERLLKPGFTLEPIGDGTFSVHDPSGYSLRNKNRMIRVSQNLWDGSRMQRDLVNTLIERGAIDPKHKQSTPRRRVHGQDHKPKAAQVKHATNPIILSRAILADSQSTGRERKIASEYLKLLEDHETIRALCKRLGEALRDASPRGSRPQ